jgi:hypothetical protein
LPDLLELCERASAWLYRSYAALLSESDRTA